MSLQRRHKRVAAPCSLLLAVELLLIGLGCCSADRPAWPHATGNGTASWAPQHAPAPAKQQPSSSSLYALRGSAEQQQQQWFLGRCDEWWFAWLRPACRQQLQQQLGEGAVSAAAGQQQQQRRQQQPGDDAVPDAAGQQQQQPAGAPLLRRRAMGDAPPIPHIIHQVFLDGLPALEEEERREEKAGREFRRFNHRWRDSCQRWHPGWQHMFWDAERAEALLKERYEWFLPTWRSYPRVVHKGDAIRPFILDAHGGLYMDVDVECFDATSAMVDGFDLVLQLEDAGNKSLNNAVMAGAPGLGLWAAMQHLLAERAPALLAMHGRPRSQRDMSHAVLYATGPWLLRDAFRAFTGDAGELAVGYAGEHTVKDTRIMVYALGQWFEPCEWSDLSCHALVDVAGVSGTPLTGIVGHHKNAGTWLKGYAEAENAASSASPWPQELQGCGCACVPTPGHPGHGRGPAGGAAVVLCWQLLRHRRGPSSAGRGRSHSTGSLRLLGPSAGLGGASWGSLVIGPGGAGRGRAGGAGGRGALGSLASLPRSHGSAVELGSFARRAASYRQQAVAAGRPGRRHHLGKAGLPRSSSQQKLSEP